MGDYWSYASTRFGSWIITFLSAWLTHPHPLREAGQKKPPALSLERLFIHPPCNLMHDDNNTIKRHLQSSKTKNNQFPAPQPCKYHLDPPSPHLPVVISDSSYLNSQPLSHRGLINHIQMWHLPPANVPGLPKALGQKSCLNCWNGTGRAEGCVVVPLVAWPDIRRSPMSHIAHSRQARVRAHRHTHTRVHRSSLPNSAKNTFT